MNVNNIKILAERVRGIGRELLAIAKQIQTEATHLSVRLPQPNLFSDLYIASAERPETGEISHELPVAEELPQPQEETPKTRHYHRNGKRMQEHLAVSTAERVGKAQGFCSRSDIERSIARMTGRSREDVREAVNRVAERMQLTCVKSNSYRYYPKSQRDAIINASKEELERI